MLLHEKFSVHPWKRHSWIVSRATSVACRLFQSSFLSLQILTQQQLITRFLCRAQQYFSTLGIEVEVAGFKLDLKRMFPSLDKSMPRQAYTNLFDRCKKMYCYHRTEKHVYISVGVAVCPLDTRGGGGYVEQPPER